MTVQDGLGGVWGRGVVCLGCGLFLLWCWVGWGVGGGLYFISVLDWAANMFSMDRKRLLFIDWTGKGSQFQKIEGARAKEAAQMRTRGTWRGRANGEGTQPWTKRRPPAPGEDNICPSRTERVKKSEKNETRLKEDETPGRWGKSPAHARVKGATPAYGIEKVPGRWG